MLKKLEKVYLCIEKWYDRDDNNIRGKNKNIYIHILLSDPVDSSCDSAITFNLGTTFPGTRFANENTR